MKLEQILETEYVSVCADGEVVGLTEVSADIFKETDEKKLLQLLADEIEGNGSDFESAEDSCSYNLGTLTLEDISYCEKDDKEFAIVSGTWEAVYINDYGDEEGEEEFSVEFTLSI